MALKNFFKKAFAKDWLEGGFSRNMRCTVHEFQPQMKQDRTWVRLIFLTCHLLWKILNRPQIPAASDGLF